MNVSDISLLTGEITCTAFFLQLLGSDACAGNNYFCAAAKMLP